ncbi:MAG: DNA polymerase III subunit alpha [Candidatus Aminicenantia bacterium]
MKTPGYLPLRVRSSFSEGGISIKELIKEMENFSFVPLADIEGIWGWGRLKRGCSRKKDLALKPLYGAEVSLNGEKFLLFVKDKEGYYNLCKIINRTDLKGKGIVAIYIPSNSENNPLTEVFDDIYIGITFGNLKFINHFKKRGNPLVWANPVNYFSNVTLYSLVLSIRKGIPFPRLEREKLTQFSFLPKSFIEKFVDNEEIFKNTWEIAEKCKFELEELIPKFNEGVEELREILIGRVIHLNLNSKYRERIEGELKVVEESGFSWLFLLAHEISNFARESGILYNLRGSGASSLIAYILGISRIDPIKAGLYFERFLNIGREEPPDLDIDFESHRRDEVIEYVFKKYSDRVCFVTSFKNFKARSALYFTGKALGFSPSELRELTRKVPFFAEPSILRERPSPPGIERLWRLASLLDGIHFQKSLHVGGLIFTPYPLKSFLPVENSVKGYPMTQFDKEDVEDTKIIKIDLLGVRGLSTISMTMKNLNLREISEDDEETFKLIEKGETIGCFQIESPAMIDLLRKIKPRNVYELADALALIRPGPTESGMKRGMIMIKNGNRFEPHPILRKLLPESSGLIIYEEQIMEIAQRLGFEWKEAEILRNFLKKGRGEEIREKFLRKGREAGFEENEVEEIWKILNFFSSYTFNKAHAHSYAWSAYLSAYLKTHYPLEFFASLLNSGGGYYPPWEYLEEAKRRGSRILPPDVNKSEVLVKVEEGSLRKGLSFVKGLRNETIKRITEERLKKPFNSLQDFFERVKPKREETLSLINSGALDSLGPLSLQISFYLHGIPLSIKILRDSRRIEISLSELLRDKRNGECKYKINNLFSANGEVVSLPVRIVDARIKRVNGKFMVFYLFEDETGIVEGCSLDLKIPGNRLSIVKGLVRVIDGNVKIFDCEFENLF